MRQFAAYERRARAVRLTRVYVDAPLRPGGLIELPPPTAQHLAKVLRARCGDALTVFAGDGREYAALVHSVRGARVTVALGAASEVDRESPLAVTLIQCVPRGDRMDFIVQKATELGVARIVPALSRRSVVRLGAAQAESKAAHWRAVAVSACEQCGRNRLPVIEEPRPLIEYLGEAPDPEQAGARLLLDPQFESRGRARAVGAAVEVAIGPEGGLDAEELEAFRISGFATLKLGPRILRTETAAIAALAWLQSRFGDLQADV